MIAENQESVARQVEKMSNDPEKIILLTLGAEGSVGIKDGEIINPYLSTYLIPTALDIPQVQTVIVEKPDPRGPFGAKGIGEPPNVMPMPALVNAIRDACGVSVREIPVTPEKLLTKLRAAETQE